MNPSRSRYAERLLAYKNLQLSILKKLDVHSDDGVFQQLRKWTDRENHYALSSQEQSNEESDVNFSGNFKNEIWKNYLELDRQVNLLSEKLTRDLRTTILTHELKRNLVFSEFQ